MRSVVGVVLLLAVLTGCTEPVEPIDALPASPAPPPVDVRSADPPTRFTDKPSAVLDISTDAREVLLHGLTAIVPIHGSEPLAPRTGEELRLVDTRTGTTRASVRPTHPLPRSGVIALPTLTTVNGRATVLMPFLGEAPGQGTTPGRPLIEVVSVDPENGEADWRLEIPLEGWKAPAGTNDAEISFAGVVDGVALIRLEEKEPVRRKGGTYALDLATRTVLWHQAGFESRALAGGVVVGRQQGTGVRVLGLDARTGRQRWASSRPADSLREVHRAGPTLAVVEGAISGADYLDVVDIATGRVVGARQEKPGESSLLVTGRCVYDEQAVTVCDGNDWIIALDAKTGTERWSLAKTGGRLVPRVTGAWHGVVYGWVDRGRAVVLDARTGADRETRPGTYPSVVNGSMAIGPWPGGSTGSGIYPVLG